MQADMKRIVCLGDSITWGFPHGPEYSWVRMLDDAISDDIEVINQGINGNTTSDMLDRFNRAVIKKKPTHLIIMGGINDVIWRESFDRITLNLKTMAEKAKENGIQVIMGTPTAVDDPEPERRLQRLRDWIKEYAAQNKLAVIDFASAFYDSNGKIRLEYLLADGGHPTRQGYQALFAQIDINLFT